MKTIISLSALLVSVVLVQMGIGSLRPFDTISGQALGFSSIEIGFIASGHFAGFLLGCLFSPNLVKRVGHSRAFAVMAGVAVISIIAHPIYPDPLFWVFIRVFSLFFDARQTSFFTMVYAHFVIIFTQILIEPQYLRQ